MAQAVAVPQWMCEKCGASCDVKHIPACTAEALAKHLARTSGLVWSNFIGEMTDQMREGVAHGEHLRLRCARCGYRDRVPVAQVKMIPLVDDAPIFDSLVAEYGRPLRF